MKAKKENKVYSITTEQEKQRYLKEGYDIYSDDGKLLEYSPQKKISYSQYEALRKENDALKQERLVLRGENEALRKENETLAGENDMLQRKLEPADTGAGEAVQDNPETGQEGKTARTSGKKAGG